MRACNKPNSYQFMKGLLNFTTLTGLTILGCLTCPVVPSAQAASYNISMTADGFVPAYLEVTVGDRVYWWNDDYDYYDYHSTHSYSYPWDSGMVDVGYGVYLDTAKTGSYDYVDDWGYTGWGTLVIKAAGPPPPTLISAPNRVDMVLRCGPGHSLHHQRQHGFALSTGLRFVPDTVPAQRQPHGPRFIAGWQYPDGGGFLSHLNERVGARD
jgi:plastocyanin